MDSKKKNLKLFYYVSWVRYVPLNGLITFHAKDKPCDLFSRIKFLEKGVKQGQVLSFCIETLFE